MIDRTILVVDDDHINIQVIAAMLSADGYQVLQADSGDRCLQSARKQQPDLILMDINMPVMSGIEACGHLKADPRTRAIPVIFVTSNTDDDTLHAAYDAGGSDYVHKPINRIELMARVNATLREKAAARRLAEDEKLKGVLETAGGVCHELNQPLQYILGSIQLIMLDVSEKEPMHASLKNILRQVERMGDITRKLMDITRYKTRRYADGKSILDIEQSSKRDEFP